MISPQLLEVLVCPQCKHSVKQQGETLVCVECRLVFPVRDGIPVMLPEEAGKLS